MNEEYLDLSNPAAFNNDPALHAQLKIDGEADANAARWQLLPPSELVMGLGKPYKASVAFVEADPKKRWKKHTENKKTGKKYDIPFYGTKVQYTIIDSPGQQYDGYTVSEYVMTMVNNNGTCGAMGLLQGLNAWNPNMRTPAEMIMALEQSIARTPVVGVHTDWEGQSVSVRQDGTKQYDSVDGLDTWRAFWEANGRPVDAANKPIMPPGRIELKNADGSPRLDAAGQHMAYIASARVTRREPAGSPSTGNNGGAFNQGFAPQQPAANPWAQAQGYAPPQAPPQAQGYAPQQQYAPQPPQQQYAAPAPPAPPSAAPVGPQAQGQPTAPPWATQPPAWVTGKG